METKRPRGCHLGWVIEALIVYGAGTLLALKRQGEQKEASFPLGTGESQLGLLTFKARSPPRETPDFLVIT